MSVTPAVSYDVLIVGTGHAGAQVAISLRQGGFEGSVALLGEEPEPPYERPPLSKDYLSGEKPFERILIRPVSFWAERGIDLIPGKTIKRLDATEKFVEADTGEVFGFRRLVWATGGAPRRLSCDGSQLAGVHAVRSRADVDCLRRELDVGNRVVVIGGGYIGLEASAVMSKAGKQVTLLEAQPRVLARVAGEVISNFYECEHTRHGVEIRVGEQVECLLGANGSVSGVRLRGGEVLVTDVVIVGIGIVPSVSALLDASAVVSDGVDVDAACRTSLPDVWAVGDCARQVNRHVGDAAVRIESVQNAVDQAKAAVADILCLPAPEQAVPWFWSNQYDLRLQTAGIAAGADLQIVRGDVATRRFSVVYLRDGRVVALDCVNSTKDFVAARRLIESRAKLPSERLADVAIPLISLLQ